MINIRGRENQSLLMVLVHQIVIMIMIWISILRCMMRMIQRFSRAKIIGIFSLFMILTSILEKIIVKNYKDIWI